MSGKWALLCIIHELRNLDGIIQLKRERERKHEYVKPKIYLKVKDSAIQDSDWFFWISHVPRVSLIPRSGVYIVFLCDAQDWFPRYSLGSDKSTVEVSYLDTE